VPSSSTSSIQVEVKIAAMAKQATLKADHANVERRLGGYGERAFDILSEEMDGNSRKYTGTGARSGTSCGRLRTAGDSPTG
jgi:hypothetical protein